MLWGVLSGATARPSATALRWFPLEASGARKQEIALVQQAGAVSFELSAANQTMHYEIVR